MENWIPVSSTGMTRLSSCRREPSYRDSFAVSHPLTSSGMTRCHREPS
ncbi:hypothetical protein [Wolbachia endosymbiont (group A) of Apoderus coryli]|nr:hypothetical protein [Wolbachia endosymbiont (group A) of Apoderus coryli]